MNHKPITTTIFQLGQCGIRKPYNTYTNLKSNVCLYTHVYIHTLCALYKLNHKSLKALIRFDFEQPNLYIHIEYIYTQNQTTGSPKKLWIKKIQLWKQEAPYSAIQYIYIHKLREKIIYHDEGCEWDLIADAETLTVSLSLSLFLSLFLSLLLDLKRVAHKFSAIL